MALISSEPWEYQAIGTVIIVDDQAPPPQDQGQYGPGAWKLVRKFTKLKGKDMKWNPNQFEFPIDSFYQCKKANRRGDHSDYKEVQKKANRTMEYLAEREEGQLFLVWHDWLFTETALKRFRAAWKKGK